MAAAATAVAAVAVAAAAAAAADADADERFQTHLVQDRVKGCAGVRQRTRVGNAQVDGPLAEELGGSAHALGAVVEEGEPLPAVVKHAYHRRVVTDTRHQHSRRPVWAHLHRWHTWCDAGVTLV